MSRKHTSRMLAAQPASCPVPYPPVPLPCKEPKVGQTVTVYSTGVAGWQSDIGSGWRYLLVIKVGRAWVTLFQMPTLVTVKWSLVPRKHGEEAKAVSDWEFYSPRPYDADPTALLKILERNEASAERHQLQYSKANAALARCVLGKLVLP